MKILFIEPKSPGYNVYSYFKLPLMGLPILGAILKKEGHEVSICVENFSNSSNYDNIKPDFVGISLLTSTANRGYEIADHFRKRGTKVMIGGAHATIMPEEARQHADYVVKREGEGVILDIVNGRYGEGIIEGKPVKNLDEIPFPDISLMKKAEKNIVQKAQGMIDRYAEITPILTSRGCPWDCPFCSVIKTFGREYRFRSPENVMEEIRMRKPRRIFFYDDNFTASPARAKTLLEMLLKEKEKTGNKIKWTAQARVDGTRDEELLDLMRRTDCDKLFIGIESVNPDTLKKYNKGQTIEDIESCMSRLNRHGIKTHGMYVIGSDDDTADIFGKTLEFSEKHGNATAQFTVLTPFPGTRIYEDLEKQGRIMTKNWSIYDGHHAVFKPRNFTQSGLEAGAMQAMKKFYSLRRGAKVLRQGEVENAFYRFMGSYIIARWEKSDFSAAA